MTETKTKDQATMNATDRFCTVLRGEIPDRIPIMVYAMDPQRVRYTVPTILLEVPPGLNDSVPAEIDPNIAAVLDLAGEVATFAVGVAHPTEPLFTGAPLDIQSERLAYHNPDYYEWRNVLSTPKGSLSCANLLSDKQLPPYEKELLLKEPEDIEKLLSIPFEDFSITSDWVQEQKAKFDDRCLILWNVGSAPAAIIYHHAGAERFALWTIEHRNLLLHATAELTRHRLKLVDALLSAGAGPVFHTSGYEDFIPPLLSPQDLHEFIMPNEKQFCDRVHAGGAYVWAHSHGRVSDFLEDFAEIGVDCLQPIEPPPMGDVDWADAKRRIGDRVTLVGNIQTHEIMTAPNKTLEEMVTECVTIGKPNGRFALGPSAELIVTPTITDLHRDNLLTYFRVGRELGKY